MKSLPVRTSRFLTLVALCMIASASFAYSQTKAPASSAAKAAAAPSNSNLAKAIGNPNAPFINSYMASSNLATNYFGVAHPSLTNYLEIAGGSNFGVLSDNSPDWHNTTCKPNLATKKTTNESVSTAICPIAGTGTDAPTPAELVTMKIAQLLL